MAFLHTNKHSSDALRISLGQPIKQLLKDGKIILSLPKMLMSLSTAVSLTWELEHKGSLNASFPGHKTEKNDSLTTTYDTRQPKDVLRPQNEW